MLDNYRAKTLSSLIGKLIDHLILNRYSNVFTTSSLLIIFKPGSSCNQCTFCVSETLEHFVANGSLPVACFLDLQKAFDHISLFLLFKTCDCGAPAHLTRGLLGLHTQQQLCVLWNGATSDSFYANNGVKQGGVKSPILFCVYIDDFLQQFIALDLRCHIGSVFCAVFAYIGDIVLLLPSITALQTMLNVSSYSCHLLQHYRPC